jgi:type II secretory pathway component PulM
LNSQLLTEDETVTNYRYKQLLIPMDRYLRGLNPQAKRWLALAEGGLLLLLLTSVIFYVQ